MERLLVVTGPPGAGKSTVTQMFARRAARSVLVAGDSFFGFWPVVRWSRGYPSRTTRTKSSRGRPPRLQVRSPGAGYATVYDGVVGPWFLPTFVEATGLGRLEYVVLLPSVETCVRRVATRQGHGFTDEAATRKMHAEFAQADIGGRHIIHDPPGDAFGLADRIEAALAAGAITYPPR
jgi:hypothetical protein